MKDGDYDAALDAFASAVVLDPENGEALFGYSLLNVTDISTDPEIVAAMQEDLGLVGYPSSMNEIVNNTWLEVVEIPDGSEGTYSMLLPEIDGQADQNEDGVIDPFERLDAFMTYLTAHATQPSDVAAAYDAALGERLDNAIAAITSLPEGISVTYTWDMFVDSQEDWPEDDNEDPIEMTIGKAELELVAAQLSAYRAFLDLFMAYDLTFPTDGFIEDFYEGNVDSLENPFSTFLNLSADAVERYQAALGSMESAASLVSNAFADIISDRSGFTLASGSSIWDTDVTWDDSVVYMEFIKNNADQVVNSIQNITTAIVVPFYIAETSNIDAINSSWPTAPGMDADGYYYAVELNFATLLGTPISLFEFFGSTSENEPLFYELNASDFSFTEVTTAPDPSVSDTYYVMIDAGVLDDSVDYGLDWSTLSYLNDGTYASMKEYLEDVFSPYVSPDYGDIRWEDTDNDNRWDNGETITAVYISEYSSNFNINVIGSMDMFNGADPNEFQMDVLDFSDTTLAEFVDTTNGSTVTDFRDAISSAGIDTGVEFYNDFQFIDPEDHIVFTSDLGMAGTSPEAVWHSMTAEGTSGENSEEETITSLGSFWVYMYALMMGL